MAEDCQICYKIVQEEDEALLCDKCERWSHRMCLGMNKTNYKKLEKSKNPWICLKCSNPASNKSTIKNMEPKKDNYTNSDIMEKLMEMDEKYSKLFAKYEEQRQINEDLKNELQVIKKQLNVKEQQQLNNNIIIQGVPYKENEKVEETIRKITNILGVVNNAEKCFRLGSGNGSKLAPIKVVFKNSEDKEKWMLAKKNKNLNTAIFEQSNPPKPIYLNHDLTKRNFELFMAAKKFKNDNDYKYLWINNGKILMRKSDDSKILLIGDETDLKN